MNNPGNFPATALLPSSSIVLLLDYHIEEFPMKDSWYTLEVSASQQFQNIKDSQKLPLFRLQSFNSIQNSPYLITRSFMHFALLYVRIEALFGNFAKKSFKISKNFDKNKSISNSRINKDSIKNDDISQFINALFFEDSNYNIRISPPVLQFFGPWESDLPIHKSQTDPENFRIPTFSFEHSVSSDSNTQNPSSFLNKNSLGMHFLDLDKFPELKDVPNDRYSIFKALDNIDKNISRRGDLLFSDLKVAGTNMSVVFSKPLTRINENIPSQNPSNSDLNNSSDKPPKVDTSLDKSNSTKLSSASSILRKFMGSSNPSKSRSNSQSQNSYESPKTPSKQSSALQIIGIEYNNGNASKNWSEELNEIINEKVFGNTPKKSSMSSQPTPSPPPPIPPHSTSSPAPDSSLINNILNDQSLNPIVIELYLLENLMDSILSSYTPKSTKLRDLLLSNSELVNLFNSSSGLQFQNISLSYSKSKRVLSVNTISKIDDLLNNKLVLPVLKLYFEIPINSGKKKPLITQFDELYSQTKSPSIPVPRTNPKNNDNVFPINKNSISREYFKKLNELSTKDLISIGENSKPSDVIGSQVPKSSKKLSATSLSNNFPNDTSQSSPQDINSDSTNYPSSSSNDNSPKTLPNPISNYNPQVRSEPQPRKSSGFYIGDDSDGSAISLTHALNDLPDNQTSIKDSLGYSNLDINKVPMSNPSSQNSFNACQMEKLYPIAPELIESNPSLFPTPNTSSAKLSRAPTLPKLNESLSSIRFHKKNSNASMKSEARSGQNSSKEDIISEPAESGVGLFRSFSLKTKKAVLGSIRSKSTRKKKSPPPQDPDPIPLHDAPYSENYYTALGTKKFSSTEDSRDSVAIFKEMERQLSIKKKTFDDRQKIVSAAYLNSYVESLPQLSNNQFHDLQVESSIKISKFFVKSPNHKSSLLRNDLVHFKFIVGEGCSLIIPFSGTVSFNNLREKMLSKFIDSGYSLSKIKRLVMVVNMGGIGKINLIENAESFKMTMGHFFELIRSRQDLILSSKTNKAQIKSSGQRSKNNDSSPNYGHTNSANSPKDPRSFLASLDINSPVCEHVFKFSIYLVHPSKVQSLLASPPKI
ncbi:hypothetical protein AYI68_g616 [Smittium mucronatum]|uniref:Uncharacterized protein n=1 Tax=Smittium mucronatum TaxID=133383 RepID=A0A1R0H7T4_9FUNG|nr:hypothetical protein AYI68_g616 [Smittium mucronatum]